jgi:hypothetical protein
MMMARNQRNRHPSMPPNATAMKDLHTSRNSKSARR